MVYNVVEKKVVSKNAIQRMEFLLTTQNIIHTIMLRNFLAQISEKHHILIRQRIFLFHNHKLIFLKSCFFPANESLTTLGGRLRRM